MWKYCMMLPCLGPPPVAVDAAFPPPAALPGDLTEGAPPPFLLGEAAGLGAAALVVEVELGAGLGLGLELGGLVAGAEPVGWASVPVRSTRGALVGVGVEAWVVVVVGGWGLATVRLGLELEERFVTSCRADAGAGTWRDQQVGFGRDGMMRWDAVRLVGLG